MRLYTIPKIKKPASGKWYIEYTYAVPAILRDQYPRKTKRFKVYDGINRVTGEDKDIYAEELRKDWEVLLKRIHFNPFEKEMKLVQWLNDEEAKVEAEAAAIMAAEVARIKEAETRESKKTEKDRRKEVSIYTALERFIESRKDRTDNGNTVSSYRVTVKWLSDYFEDQKRLMEPISMVDHLDISSALVATKRLRSWGNTTYNNELTNTMTIFNWMAAEYYIVENPSTGRIKKFKTNKSTKNWYTRDIAKTLKEELLKRNCISVYRACQFTYWICIRSKAEIMKLRIGDVDRALKRIRFSAALSKDGVECFRDYPAQFDQVLDEMEFDKYPRHYFVFGKNGLPGERSCHKDFLAEQFKPIRDDLGLSDKYQIYTWKRTRTIHEMMRGTDPYHIQHMLRHDDIKTTLDYMRGFDISLVNVYGPEDLTF